jgi:hypothetical protein
MLPEERVGFTERNGLLPGDLLNPLTELVSRKVRDQLDLEIEGIDYNVNEDIQKLSEELISFTRMCGPVWEKKKNMRKGLRF